MPARSRLIPRLSLPLSEAVLVLNAVVLSGAVLVLDRLSG